MMTEAGRDQETVIDIASLMESLKVKTLGKLSMSPNCSIFRVPNILLRHKPSAYTPNQFSFGPFHHQNETIRQTERIKHKYLRDLLNRLPKQDLEEDSDATLRDLTKAVANVWREARDHYAGPIDMEPEKFIEVMVLDGCFIVELFRKSAYQDLYEKDDPIFSMSCLYEFLCHDLILLENQIPWMVLEILFNKTNTSIDEKGLVEITFDYFPRIFSTTPPPIDKLVKNLKGGSKHILDLLRDSIVTSSRVARETSSECETKRSTSSLCASRETMYKLEAMRSASSLDDSGIEFKPLSTSLILDVKFNKKKGILYIPTLFIQETTDTIFRNLISLEQCCPHYEDVVTSYAVLLDSLIDTKEDLEILRTKKVIETWVNVGDAAQIFNKLYVDTAVNNIIYLPLTRDVNKYCQQHWHRYRRVLKRDYFKHPWALISVLAASIILILTFTQTVYAIKE